MRIQVLEADPTTATGGHRVALARVTTVGDLPCGPVLLDHHQGVTRATDAGQTDDLHWTRRGGLGDVLAVFVDHAPDATVCVAGDDRVADPKGAALDEHRGDRSATAVQVRLDGHTLRVHLRVRPQVERRIGGQDDGLEQRLDVETLLGGDVDEHRVAAVLLRNKSVLGHLAADLVGLRALLVDLVDRHDDRHVGRLRVVDRLDSLRHHAVVRRHHDDRDVGRLGAARTHRGERLVTGGVDEGDGPIDLVDRDGHLVRTDVLGDASGLALAYLGGADAVEQPRLTVVDVTHDRHDGRTNLEVILATLVLTERQVERIQQFAVLVLGADDLNLETHLLAEELEGLRRHGLRGRDHLTQVEQRLNELRRVHVDLVGEVAQRGTLCQSKDLAATVGKPDAADLWSPHRVVFLTLLPLRLTTATRGATRTTERTRGTAATTIAATGTTPETATATGGSAATWTETSTTGTTAGTTRTAPTRSGASDLTRHLAGARTRRHVAGRGARTALSRSARALGRTGSTLAWRRTCSTRTRARLAWSRTGTGLGTRSRCGATRVRVVADTRCLGTGFRSSRARAGCRA